MRLSDLAISAGSTLGAVAQRVGVDRLLMERIDAGEQPMPVDLGGHVALVLGVDPSTVMSSCPLTTRLGGPRLRVPIPPRQEELQPPTRIYPTQAVRTPDVGGGSLYVFGGPESASIVGNSVMHRFRVSRSGSLGLVAQVLDTDPAYDNGLLGTVSGVIGQQGELWFGGDNADLQPITGRVNSGNLTKLNYFTWDLGLHVFAKGALDPATGRVWVTIADGNVYVFSSGSLPSGPDTNVATALDDSSYNVVSMCFPGDGYLYVGATNNIQQVVIKIDPRPGSEGIVASTAAPLPDDTASGPMMLEWVETAGKFYSGTVGGLIAWDRDTLAGTFIGDPDSLVLNLGGAYDPETDSFWTVVYDFDASPFYPARVSRLTGLVEIAGQPYNAAFSAPYAPGLSSARMAFYPGQQNADDQRRVFAYAMDPTSSPVSPAYSIPIGTGPNPIGFNILLGAVLYAPG